MASIGPNHSSPISGQPATPSKVNQKESSEKAADAGPIDKESLAVNPNDKAATPKEVDVDKEAEKIQKYREAYAAAHRAPLSQEHKQFLKDVLNYVNDNYKDAAREKVTWQLKQSTLTDGRDSFGREMSVETLIDNLQNYWDADGPAPGGLLNDNYRYRDYE